VIGLARESVAGRIESYRPIGNSDSVQEAPWDERGGPEEFWRLSDNLHTMRVCRGKRLPPQVICRTAIRRLSRPKATRDRFGAVAACTGGEVALATTGRRHMNRAHNLILWTVSGDPSGSVNFLSRTDTSPVSSGTP
jgi:hypothetical protein